MKGCAFLKERSEPRLPDIFLKNAQSLFSSREKRMVGSGPEGSGVGCNQYDQRGEDKDDEDHGGSGGAG